ncbi:MAG: GH92 family glycosyl hydrolase [Tannerella sp.]|jgi:predicted alpha-1,2-mannosidase|nr:GH92 family glycosyl hydrolase [Tannerella sp.]
MKRKIQLSVIFLSACLMQTSAQSPVDYVSTLVGTQSKHSLSTGNTYPAIALPWGMNFWTPQTGKMGDGWAYTYDADKIRGFKQTHQPSPWINDYGQFSIMPLTGEPLINEDARASWFSHKTEIAKPHYYRVYLADHDVVTEITPTERAALFRFTFPEREFSYVAIDPCDGDSYVKIIPEENKIVGYSTKNSGGVPGNFKNYFVIVFDKNFTYTTSTVKDVKADDVIRSSTAHAIVGFPTRRGETVHVRVASSFISLEQAELNLKELGNNDFETVKKNGEKRWNEVLGRIEIESNDVDKLRTFYSCLYRSVLFPRSFFEYDKDGNAVHYSPYNGQVLPGYMFTDTGFWDTFRALFPLLNLLYPEVNAQIQEGLINTYRESSFFPEWASPGHRGCMVGNNSASVLADAFLQGIKVKDVDALWEGVVYSANHVHPKISSTGRKGYEYYNRLGYVPCDVKINESAARTLEYAYDDWCIYQLGKAIGKPEEEISVYAERSFNYRHLFNRKYNLMCGKKENGEFNEPFSPLKWGGDFTEGNALHYTWSVFHDPQGLIDLMGGKETFIQMLDTVFAMPPAFDDSYYGSTIHEIREMQIMNMGNYAHGNQPIQHMIYLYNYAGAPWKAQYRLRQVMNSMYSPAPDGYCGDEDNGQTSAWYVFSALGFYPVCPGSGQYVLGSPLFPKATLHLQNGKTVEIRSNSNSDTNVYVKSLKLNGKNCTRNYLEIETLKRGAKLLFEMDGKPNTQRGTDADDFPYSFTNHSNRIKQ